MEDRDDEEDLKLVRASAGLLSDLEDTLPKLLWKRPKANTRHKSVHKVVKRRDLQFVVNLIEPFQGEPQLLDARLKHILPPTVEAYVEYLRLAPVGKAPEHLDLQSAICILLYTLCKVRGYKVIVGFLNNEPRYLEPILSKLEELLAAGQDGSSAWQVPFVLLLWLSHLLLTPFDLASISDTPASADSVNLFNVEQELPSIAIRILYAGFQYLPNPTKAQDAAATLLVRLVTRPDMQKLRVADTIVSKALLPVQNQTRDIPVTIYEQLGPLRLLSLIASSAELGHLVPNIYRACEKLSTDEISAINSNAVAKKLVVRTFRNIAILSIRCPDTQGPLLTFLETTPVLEDVIEYQFRLLGDRDTPVRYAAAKALGRIILELEPAMGHEVIQAILHTFKEDMPRHTNALDFRSVNALKWHGLTLALAHALFKRSASPEQLPDIVKMLVSALRFEQRTATGSSVGTNVRDAANFGIWSLSRRYTTEELLLVDAFVIGLVGTSSNETKTAIQGLATQLILSACLDPAGNIRRGSSAALQELTGRHPNQVKEGISLVQIVDYLAVGLRRRAMVEVAYQAAELDEVYWGALLFGLLGWRGLGSADVLSREATAVALAEFSTSKFDGETNILQLIRKRILHASTFDLEDLHGLALSLANILHNFNGLHEQGTVSGPYLWAESIGLWDVLPKLLSAIAKFSPRLIRSDLLSAIASLVGALCRWACRDNVHPSILTSVPHERLDEVAERLLSRHETTIQAAVPLMVRSLFALKRQSKEPLGCIGAQTLSKKVAVESSKSTLNGACGAIALGTLATSYKGGLCGEKAKTSVSTLATLTNAMNVDWRIVGVKALQLVVESVKPGASIDNAILEIIIDAIHRSLNDYTIDERGDVGSLVRLQAISCASSILETQQVGQEFDLQILHADIHRLSLEKLDRVRLEAAHCRQQYLDLCDPSTDIAGVSSYQYFKEALKPLSVSDETWKHRALLEGCISCAGISAEPVLQASRAALAATLTAAQTKELADLMAFYANILKSLLLEGAYMLPALELLAFLLDTQIPQRLTESDFKWRNVMSTIQKSHHKSNDIPRILAAVQVYRGLAEVPTIREESLKKLISMCRTNPYPRIRSSVAEALFVVTGDSSLRDKDWMKPASQYLDAIEKLQKDYVKT